jgi:hypothetical protein
MRGHDHLVSVSLFEHEPQCCPFGHQLWPGLAQVGWKPCICTAAREGAERGRGMGHLWVSCKTCHEELWSTTFYEPPHDIKHHQPGPWLASLRHPRCRRSSWFPDPKSRSRHQQLPFLVPVGVVIRWT